MDGVSNLTNFLAAHTPQLVLSGIPQHFWEKLYKKLFYQILDAGEKMQLAQITYEEAAMPYDPVWTLLAICEIDKLDSNNIFLIDHAWTFKPNDIKSDLQIIPGLLDRMCNMMQVSDTSTDEKINKVARLVWKYANTFNFNGNELPVEHRVPYWYVLDELGSSIVHSDSPNFRAVPFYYIPERYAYTLIFPKENVEKGQAITRNFIENCNDELQREALLIPWKQYCYFNEDYTQQEPEDIYFLDGHIRETLPNLDVLQENRCTKTKLKVYSEYGLIAQYLTSPEFQIVNNEQEADVLWYLNHFKTFLELSEESPHKFVNQFPFEYLITIKDLLAIIARRCIPTFTNTTNNQLQTYPTWLPTTFNMKTELPKLVAYYMQRKNLGLDNIWICKPFNLARGLDTILTDSLYCLCRLPVSGPKIAQKYVEDPILFEIPELGLVKFDIRYVIILKSVHPTEVFVYKNFFLRFSNKPFDLNNFEDYEKHFTVMNYTEANLHRLLCSEFKQKWTEQYSNYKWDEIEESIFVMFKELFEAATSKDVPRGIAKSPQSRALYAADIILSWYKDGNDKKIQPKLLEVNWMPDCQRACEYYPDFYNDVFSVMFLNKQQNNFMKIM